MLAADLNARNSGIISPADAGVSNASWTALGPGVSAVASAFFSHRLPGNPQVLFASSVGGGIWKTLAPAPRGSRWKQLRRDLSVSSIVVNPQTRRDVCRDRGGLLAAMPSVAPACSKTTNGGSSWYQLAAASPSASSDWLYVNRLASPDQPADLLAATNGGVYRSSNGGSSWAR